MTDRNILWAIANSTNIRANQRYNATITDADISRMHYFQQAQATGQKAQFYNQYVLPSQGGLPRDYDFQIAAMEFKIEQEHVNSENQILAPQQIKENIETKMEISSKNDIIEKINKLTESLTSLLNEQSIATTKIYTVFKEYNNFSQYYNNSVNEIANDVQFRSQFINKIVQLEDLFKKLLTEVSDYITSGYAKPDLKVVSMGQIEVILQDIMKTLALMLDVKPTTPFINQTDSLVFGQVKARNGQFREPKAPNYGDMIDEQGESKYLEDDTVPNIGYTEDELRELEEGTITQEELDERYKEYDELARSYIAEYVQQEFALSQGVEIDEGDIITKEATESKLRGLRVSPEKLKQIWRDVRSEIFKSINKPKPIKKEQKEILQTIITNLIQAAPTNKTFYLGELENKRLEYNLTEAQVFMIMEQVRTQLRSKNKAKIKALITSYIKDIKDASEDERTKIRDKALSDADNLGVTETIFEQLLAKNTGSTERGLRRKLSLFNAALQQYFRDIEAAVGDEAAQDELNDRLRNEGENVIGLTPEQMKDEFYAVRNTVIDFIIRNFLNTRNLFEDEGERDGYTEMFIRMSKSLGYSDDALRRLVASAEEGDEGEEDSGGTPLKPTAINTSYNLYGQYIAKIARILKPVAPKAITINTIAGVLFNAVWIEYYNENYGVDVEVKPLVASLINKEMLDRIKEELRIGTIDYEEKCAQLIKDATI
jgi:hypothetical protein